MHDVCRAAAQAKQSYRRQYRRATSFRIAELGIWAGVQPGRRFQGVGPEELPILQLDGLAAVPDSDPGPQPSLGDGNTLFGLAHRGVRQSADSLVHLKRAHTHHHPRGADSITPPDEGGVHRALRCRRSHLPICRWAVTDCEYRTQTPELRWSWLIGNSSRLRDLLIRWTQVIRVPLDSRRNSRSMHATPFRESGHLYFNVAIPGHISGLNLPLVICEQTDKLHQSRRLAFPIRC